MNIVKNLNGSTLEIALEGRLDTTTAPGLDEVLKDIPASVETLILDCENLEYVSSAGLRVLLSAHKRMSGKGGMIVKNVTEIVQEVFDITGFADILTIE